MIAQFQAVKLNITIMILETELFFGKTDGKGNAVNEARFCAVASIAGHELARTEYTHLTSKAAAAMVKIKLQEIKK